MDVFDAINGRQSCRNFLNEPIEKETIETIIQAGIAAPSPLNSQPWKFYVITGDKLKDRLCSDADQCKGVMAEKSQWKWLEQYSVGILKKTPAIIVVTGDQKKSGVDTFSQDGPVAFQHACAAAIQNMLLAAHALGLGGLWYTLFDRQSVRQVLNLPDDQVPLAFICIGKPGKMPAQTPRKPLAEKTVFLDI